MAVLQQTLRSLSRQWGFSVFVIAIVALGVGANAAVFAAVYSVLLRGLPFERANELVVLKEAGQSLDTGLVSPTAYLEWRERNPPFSEMAAFMWWEGSGEDPVLTVSVTPNYFDVMGIKPLLGRTFTEEENRQGFSSAMILSYEVWQRKFGGNPGIIGTRVKEGVWSPMVVGIMPPAPVNLNIGWGHIWRPIHLRQQYNRSEITSARYLRVVGRLRPGFTAAGAAAAMNTIQRRLQAERPEIFAGYEVRISTLRDAIAGELRPALLILMGVTACLLLLACVSLANMLLARSASQEKEIAVRLALGATRSRLAARFLLSNLILAQGGAAFGFALCGVATVLIHRVEPAVGSLSSYSWPVAALCAGLALIVTLLVTLPMAVGVGSWRVSETLKEGGRGGTAGVRRQNWRGMMVCAEVALALSLLVVSVLLARSFAGLMGSNLGFQPDRVLMLESSIPEGQFGTGSRRIAYYRPLLRLLSGLPGVTAVGGLRYFPMHARLWTVGIQIMEKPVPAASQPIVYWNRVVGDYFRAMSIPLIAGRFPTETEMWEGNGKLLVNDVAAHALFPDGDAVGKHILGEAGQGQPDEVIGVVGSVRQGGPAKAPGPEIYALMGEGESTGILTIAIRTRERPDGAMIRSIKDAVGRYATTQAPEVISLNDFLSEAISARRLAAQLGFLFAMLSLLLAGLGIYGLVSYWVTQRMAEFGIRMALGSSPAGVLRLVLGHCLKLTGIGAAIGLAGALWIAKIISSFLYAIAAFDLPAFLISPLILLAVATLAALRPAWRATRIDAMEALRSE